MKTRIRSLLIAAVAAAAALTAAPCRAEFVEFSGPCPRGEYSLPRPGLDWSKSRVWIEAQPMPGLNVKRPLGPDELHSYWLWFSFDYLTSHGYLMADLNAMTQAQLQALIPNLVETHRREARQRRISEGLDGLKARLEGLGEGQK